MMVQSWSHPPVGVVEREGHLLHHAVRMVRLVRRHLRPCKGFEHPADCCVLGLINCCMLVAASLAERTGFVIVF